MEEIDIRKTHLRGRGNYAVKVTLDNKRGLGSQTFEKKETANNYLKKLKEKYPQYKCPKIVKIKK